jgi:hypothetical protein
MTSLFLLNVMLLLFFLAGFICFAVGVTLLFTREYRDAMKQLSIHSAAIGAKATVDLTLAPIMDSASHLIDAVSNMVRTGTGVGAFLCLLGATMDIVAFWMLSTLK